MLIAMLRGVLILSVLLASCRGAGSPEPAASPEPSPLPTATAQAPPVTLSPTTATPSPSQACAPIKGGTNTFLQLTTVRVGSHDGFDRVTFEFKPPTAPPPVPAVPDALPRYELKRVASVTEDASGKPLNVTGRDLYQIVFFGASGVELGGDQPVATYRGPRELRPDLKLLAEVEQSGDFESTLSWALGLKRPRCLKVQELKNPVRLAIDIPY